MRPWITLAALIATGLWPAVGHAATFEVNTTSDDPDLEADGRCDTDTATAGRQCSFRGALLEANARPNRDRIEFDSAVFDGTLGDAIEADLGFLPVSDNVEIDAGDCGAGPLHQPCAGVDSGDGNSALVIGGDDVSIRGLALYGSGVMGAGIRAFGADRLRVRNSWFGRRLNGTSSINGIGISLEVSGDGSDDIDEARIGGKRAADTNVFGGGSRGVYVEGGDRNRILGNLFGVDAFGNALTPINTPISISGDLDTGEPAVGNVVGTKLSASAAATVQCDGGCNAITNGVDGISLFNGAETARKTTIAGNFIGLRPDGDSALENEFSGMAVAGSDATRIGGSARERNYITGGRNAWSQQADSRSLVVRGNLIGFDSTGHTPLDPPDGESGANTASFVRSVPDAPTIVDGNRYAQAPSTTGLTVAGERAVVTGNVFGIQRGGSALDPVANTRAILVIGSRNVIGEPGDGNVIGNLSWLNQSMLTVSGFGSDPADRNVIQGNLIGVNARGHEQPIVGDGIGLAGLVARNRVGGLTFDSENVVSNVGGNAIQIGDFGETATGNEILRNRGSDNGTESAFELFVNLQGASGFGNGDPEVNEGIEAPTIDSATRTRIEGSGAEGGAAIWIFITEDAAGDSPRNVAGFVKRTTARGSGQWSESFNSIPAEYNLTALQVDAGAGSSELAIVADP